LLPRPTWGGAIILVSDLVFVLAVNWIWGVNVESEIVIAGLSMLGTLIGSFGGSRLTAYRIEQLEKKVDKHNNFAERVPILEEQMKVANHRISDLEQYESELIKHEK
jgi:hypothetical protein